MNTAIRDYLNEIPAGCIETRTWAEQARAIIQIERNHVVDLWYLHGFGAALLNTEAYFGERPEWAAGFEAGREVSRHMVAPGWRRP